MLRESVRYGRGMWTKQLRHRADGWLADPGLQKGQKSRTSIGEEEEIYCPGIARWLLLHADEHWCWQWIILPLLPFSSCHHLHHPPHPATLHHHPEQQQQQQRRSPTMRGRAGSHGAHFAHEAAPSPALIIIPTGATANRGSSPYHQHRFVKAPPQRPTTRQYLPDRYCWAETKPSRPPDCGTFLSPSNYSVLLDPHPACVWIHRVSTTVDIP